MPDFNFLIGKAAQIVTEAFGSVRLGEITFRPKDTVAHDAGDLTTWHFVFSLPKKRAILALNDGHFDAPQLLDGGLIGDRLIDPPINKSLDDAFAILRAGGFKDPVKVAVLRQPLVFGPSGSEEPMYNFELSGTAKQIMVGANTGNVTEASPPTN
jgi:hypothetical protein